MERNITQNMDKSVVAKFIAELNQHQEHHIGYCGKDALEIEQAMMDAFGDQPDLWISTLSEDGQLTGVLGMDTDTDTGTVELWGPFIQCAPEQWQELAIRLWQQGINKLTENRIHIRKVYGFYNEHHANAIAFMKDKGAKLGSRQVILHNRSLNEVSLDQGGHNRIQTITPEQYSSFIQLHDSTFTGTYYDGETLIQRSGKEHHHLYVLPGSEKEIRGYVYAEADPEFGEGSIEYIAVNPDYSRQGLGSLLLNKVLYELNQESQVSEIRLCVDETNSGARSLYRKAGFETEHVLELYPLEHIYE
ncbi:GNAT family N-acetyltransferase [Paenibacillus illinoisensis]|uniref:GNAT family N-acetyltransferase n=1 Tax=Paenibacillus illinoisensis TaxID=59845 RepID=UPI00203E4106|nr:N-acetyltransferase [Paenibacillus illinoisensis]MCM3204901.1 GNAT family N-acetyltransferase [Paenibacillus illinoisensis]